jgi:YD repeat-containing protein
MKTREIVVAISLAAIVSNAQTNQSPCADGILVGRNAYSECGTNGVWHVVEDDYYLCPTNYLMQAFRVSDIPTTQPCGQPAPQIVGTNGAGGTIYSPLSDATNCQSATYIGSVTVSLCVDGFWEQTTYGLYQCVNKVKYVALPAVSIVRTTTPCTNAPPVPPTNSPVLFVQGPARPLSPGSASNPFTIAVLGPPGGPVQVQASSNLTDWATLAVLSSFNGAYTLTDTNSVALSHRFYRAIQAQALYVAPEYTSLIGNPLSACGCSSPENPNSSATPGNVQDNAVGNVYLETGELVQSAVDLSIPGVGFDWRFERHYRSGMNYNGPLGQGWDFSQNRRLVVQPDGDVKRIGGDGRTDLYSMLSSNSWQSPSGFYTRLTRNGDGSFVERDRHGMQTFFSAPDSFGVARMTQITDRNNNTMAFSYDSGGQLTNVTDTLGRFISYHYNTNGRLAQVEDFIGRSLIFGYDTNGDLTSVTSPAVIGTPNGNDFPSGKTTLYSYNPNHQLLTVTAANEAGVGFPARLGAQYDPASGRLASLRLGGTNATGIPAGGTLTYGYLNLAQGAPGDVTTPVFQTTVTNRDGNVTQYQFNEMGNVLSVVQFTRGLRSTDPATYTNTFAFNADGETILHTYPALNSDQFTFDSSNPDRLQQGNLLQVLRLPGPHGGDQASITTSKTYETNFNFVATSTDGRGNITRYTYDTHGNCAHITDRIPSIVQDFSYNASGQLTSRQLPDNGSGWRRLDTNIYYTIGPETGYLSDRIIDFGSFNIDNHFDPDAVGNVTNLVDGIGNNTIYFVNSLNQVVRKLSRAVSTMSGLVRYETDTFYDANNNVTNIAVENIDDTGVVVTSLPTINTSAAYDMLDDPVRRTQTVDATHTITTTNDYDADQNLILAASGQAVNGQQPNNVIQTLYDERDLVYRQIFAPNDPGHSTTQINYDGNRNVVATYQGIEDVNARITIYSYDGFDRPTSILDAMGNVTTTHYDANGNVTNKTILGELVDVPGSAGNTNLASTTFTYDALDRPVVSDDAFFDTATHTNIGTGHAIIQTIYSDNSQVLTNLDANNNPTATIYDTANRLRTVIDAKGNTKTNFYDANNNITSAVELDLSDSGQPPQTFTTIFSYDALDRRIETVDNNGDNAFDTYDSRDNHRSHVNDNGDVQTFQYDGLSRRISTSRFLAGTNAVVLQQTWDDNSRLTSQTDNNNHVTTYFYDSLNRKIGTAYADGTSAANTYDVHGNRISSTDQNGSVVISSYDLLNRVQSNNIALAFGVIGPVVEAYQYDGLSRVVLATNINSQVTRRYDSLSHLTRETQQVLPGGPIGTNSCLYDGVGNQLTCVYPGGRTIANTYDVLNRKLTISDGSFVLASNQYIGQWRVEQRFLGNGIVLNVAYDGMRRITEMQYTNPVAGFVVDDRTFSYDGDGNKFTATSATENYEYEYDALDRLTNSLDVIAFHTTSYLLDGAGNRTQVTGFVGAGAYTRNPGADFEMNQYSITPFSTNRYDHNGNLTNGTLHQLAYDYRNQLVLVTFSATGPTNTFKYDCYGRRIQQAATSGTNTFYYNGKDVIQESLAGGATNTFVPAPGPIRGMISMTLGGKLYFALHDDEGSTREATDIEGNVTESYKYTDFGSPSFFGTNGVPLSASAIGNAWLFRMERYDLATPFGYTGARYVDYELGEFVSRRKIWSDPQDLGNPRTFAGNNPLIFGSDESALCPGPACIACGIPSENSCQLYEGPYKETVWCSGDCPGSKTCFLQWRKKDSQNPWKPDDPPKPDKAGDKDNREEGMEYRCNCKTGGTNTSPTSVIGLGSGNLQFPGNGLFPITYNGTSLLTGSGGFPPGIIADKKDKPGTGGWGGVEVFSFVDCMKECEKDAEPWEVWVHAYCLTRCIAKSATGGGRLYPDNSNK